MNIKEEKKAHRSVYDWFRDQGFDVDYSFDKANEAFDWVTR